MAGRDRHENDPNDPNHGSRKSKRNSGSARDKEPGMGGSQPIRNEADRNVREASGKNTDAAEHDTHRRGPGGSANWQQGRSEEPNGRNDRSRGSN